MTVDATVVVVTGLVSASLVAVVASDPTVTATDTCGRAGGGWESTTVVGLVAVLTAVVTGLPNGGQGDSACLASSSGEAIIVVTLTGGAGALEDSTILLATTAARLLSSAFLASVGWWACLAAASDADLESAFLAGFTTFLEGVPLSLSLSLLFFLGDMVQYKEHRTVLAYT